MQNFEILIGEKQIPAEVLTYIGDVMVDDSVEVPSMFSFVVTTSDARKGSPWDWVDNEKLFSIGKPVEVKMDGGDGLTSLIVGEITALEPEFVSDGLPVLNVQGYDRRHRLQRRRRIRTFLGMTDSGIADQIGKDAGLDVKAEKTTEKLSYVMQTNQTDWEFLNQRARLIGYEVKVQDKTLFFQQVGNNKDEVHTLTMGGDLMEFYPRLSSMGQATDVKVQSWSMKEKKVIVGKSGGGQTAAKMGGRMSGAAISERAFGAAIDVVVDHPVGSQAEAQQIAQARYDRFALNFITGEGACSGNPKIKAGKVIKLDGIGKRFSGQYYVTSAIHRNSMASGYVTEFKVRRNGS